MSEEREAVPLHSTSDWSPLSVDVKSGKTQFTIRLNDHGSFYIQRPNIPKQLISGSNLEGWDRKSGILYYKTTKQIDKLLDKELEKVSVMHFDPKRADSIVPVEVKKGEDNKYYIHTDRYVGQYVAYDKDNLRLCFDIRPRFGEQLLAYMLTRIWKGADSKKVLQAVTPDPSGSLIFLALIWMGTFSEAFKNGLPRLYVEKEGDIPALKGRLNITRMIKNQINGRNLHLIPCRYRELSYDNVINRVIRRCHRIVRNVLHGYLPDTVSGELGRADKTLASYGVPLDRRMNSRDLDHIHYTSMAQAYEPLMRISKALIRGTPENLGGTLRQGQSFLFDITELWEFYIISVLKEKLGRQYDVRTSNVDEKNKAYYAKPEYLLKDEAEKEKLFKIEPDILIYNKSKDDPPVAILDAKFRRTNRGKNYGIEESDIRQLITYCAGYACTRGALIYPWDLPLAFLDSDKKEERWHETCQWEPSKITWKTFNKQWHIRLHSFVLPVLFDALRNEVLDKDLFYPFYKVQVERGRTVASLYWLRDNEENSRLPMEFKHLEKWTNSSKAEKPIEVKELLDRRPDFRTAIRNAEKAFTDRIKTFLSS